MSAPRAETLRPVLIAKDGDRLAINWNDGHRSVYAWQHLRDHCPCAGCREDKAKPPDPFHILSPAELAPKPPLQPVAMTPVGYYAYKIAWNDGHDTGLYTLENLRHLCQCETCRAKKD